jgi:hypothetical protein
MLASKMPVSTVCPCFICAKILWLANCYGEPIFTGAAQVNWLSLSERILGSETSGSAKRSATKIANTG